MAGNKLASAFPLEAGLKLKLRSKEIAAALDMDHSDPRGRKKERSAKNPGGNVRSGRTQPVVTLDDYASSEYEYVERFRRHGRRTHSTIPQGYKVRQQRLRRIPGSRSNGR